MISRGRCSLGNQQRRTRLLRLLEREHDKSRAAAYSNSLLRGARSLPSLYDELQTARRTNENVSGDLKDTRRALQPPQCHHKSKKLVAPAMFLSPLKCRVKASAAVITSAGNNAGHAAKTSVLLTARASGLFNLCDAHDQPLPPPDVSKVDEKSLKEQLVASIGRPQRQRDGREAQRIDDQAATAQRLEEQQAEQSRSIARDLQRAQLEQIDGQRLRRHERVVDDLVLREQLEWELAQADLVQQQLEKEAASGRQRHTQHLRLALEAQRLLSVVRATAGQFVDSFAVRPAKQSIEILERERDALVTFCLDKCRTAPGVTSAEREQIQSELLEQLARAHADLETRRQSEEREQRLEMERRRAMLDVQQAQRAQMARHRDAESKRRAEDAAAGDAVRRAQEDADRRAAAASLAKKERAIDNGLKIKAQIRDKEAARSFFPLRIEGCGSPVYRTPWWSDESEEQRLEGFARKDDGLHLDRKSSALSPAVVIHARKSATWYD